MAMQRIESLDFTALWIDESGVRNLKFKASSPMVNFQQEPKNVPSCVTYGSMVVGNKWYLMLLPEIGTDSNFYLHSCAEIPILQIMMMHLGRQNLSQNSH